MRGATIAEVAAEAGVGIGTVSRVLNGSPAVSDRTRRRVLDAIATLDYQPSAAARALSTGRTGAIGVIAPFFTQPSVIERLSGVSRALTTAGYELILFDVERAEQLSEFFNAGALRGRVDGLLSISLSPSPLAARRLEAARLPVVLVDRGDEGIPGITIDDVEGGRMAAEHLLALGHRRIAFLGDEEENAFGFDSSARRRVGFEAALEAAGHPLAPELRIGRPHGRDIAQDAAAGLLALADPPTAIFATSDVQAIGVLKAARAAGVSVPDELSVLGFDDVEAAEYTGLTTIAQPLEESGALGAELLLRRMSGEAVEPRELPLALVDRGSTAPFHRRSAGEGNQRKHELKSGIRRRRVHA
jgi:DNA-binding LacI/PurR family transcriptional regulator